MMRTAHDVLSLSALNRALLARQFLLARRAVGVADALEHLVGVQAQEPQGPYISLWSRLERFDPDELSELIASRRAVRGPLMRATIHLVSAGDWRWLRPLVAPVLERGFKGSPFGRATAGIELERALRRAAELLAEAPRARGELGALLGREWQEVDQLSLANAATYLLAVIQVPPRGLWRQPGRARWTTSEAWLGEPLAARASAEELIRRYLAAFGPATINDIQAWCGLTRLGEVAGRLHPELRHFRDEQGRELLDVPDAPLPDAGTPAPPRLLGPFDNAILAHADRRRIISDGAREQINRDRLMRTFLLDGFVAGGWQFEREVLHLRPLRPLAVSERGELIEEAQRMLEFIAPGRARREVRLHAAAHPDV